MTHIPPPSTRTCAMATNDCERGWLTDGSTNGEDEAVWSIETRSKVVSAFAYLPWRPSDDGDDRREPRAFYIMHVARIVNNHSD